ncbi:MAG: hypothetical protein PHO37_12625 [Kiritimatiellae bacterium]|nr:hypothetical protein [Kiritimatiellia bacterium]
MKRQKINDLIREFTLKQSGVFELKELLKYVKRKVKGFDGRERLYGLACESEWLFEDDSDLDSELFMPRHCFFKGAEFLIKPLPEEVEGGYLVPGHRLMPFIARDQVPFAATLKQPDGSVVTTRQASFVSADVIKYLVLYGDYDTIAYLVNDDPENAENFHPPYDELVNLTVFEMRDFFAGCDFKAGDSLMLIVEDWLKGVYSIRHVPSKGRAVDFGAAHDWCLALRKSFDEALWFDDLTYDCHEQASQMLWLAENCKDAPSVITNPPLTLSAFFNLQKDLVVKNLGRLSFFWPEDESFEDKMRECLEQGGPEPETELDACFQMLGLSMDIDDAEAYMRDALAHGGDDPELVLERVISGRKLYFPCADDQADFMRLWWQLWHEVCERYDPEQDCLKEMRSAFLKLNDRCLQVLRDMDNRGLDTFDVIGSPDAMKLGEMSALIHQTLMMGNLSEMEELPVPLGELSGSLSEIIEDLASRLCKPPLGC